MRPVPVGSVNSASSMPILRSTHSSESTSPLTSAMWGMSPSLLLRGRRDWSGVSTVWLHAVVLIVISAPPPAERDHERDVGADGDVRERERPVGPGEHAHEGLSADVGAATIARHARRERIDGAVRDVDERVVERVGRAEARGRRREDRAGHAGRAATGARHVCRRAEVRARSTSRCHRRLRRAPGRAQVLAVRAGVAAVERAAAAVADRAAVLGAVRGRARRGLARRIAAQIRGPAAAAGLGARAGRAGDRAAAAVADRAAVVAAGEVTGGRRERRARPAAADVGDAAAAAGLAGRAGRVAVQRAAAPVADDAAVLAARGVARLRHAARRAARVRDARAAAGLAGWDKPELPQATPMPPQPSPIVPQ